jgi:hypothetical protein
LSGSTKGQPIKIVATATPGTTIHTVPAGEMHVVYLEANNDGTTAVDLTLEIVNGGTIVTQKLSVVPKDKVRIFDTTVTDGIIIRAFAGTTNVCNITGHVNKIVTV